MALTEEDEAKEVRCSSPTRHAKRSPKRLTCVPCRERKVRCDRAFPKCGRCSHLGHNGVYRPRSSNRANQVALISQLQERMSQAEARLALRAYGASFGSDHAHNASVTGIFMEPTVQCYPQHSVPIERQHSGPPFVSTDIYPIPSSSSTTDSAIYSDLKSTAFRLGDFEQAFVQPALPPVSSSEVVVAPHDTYRSQWSNLSPSFHSRSSSEASDISITSEDLVALHQIFFESLEASFPIISRNRFYCEIRNSPADPSIQALSYAIALMTISVTGTQLYPEKGFYLRARRLLDESEIYGDGRSLANLNILQTLIILLRYEIGSQRNASSCLTAARATQLVKMMRLSQIDSRELLSGYKARYPDVSLPLANDPIELEERRRCFWALYVMEGYRNIINGDTDKILDESTPLVCLPSPGALDSSFIPIQMPYLHDAPSNLTPSALSHFTATILTTHLTLRILTHASQPPSTFWWNHHHDLVARFNSIGALLHNHSDVDAPYADQTTLELHLILSTLDSHLHAVALAASALTEIAAVVSEESRRRLGDSALRMASVVRAKWCHRLDLRADLQQDSTRQGSQSQACALSLGAMFLPWALNTAVRMLRTLGVDDGDAQVGEGVQVLLAALDNVEERSGPWHQSLRT
ncbi:hypothetical protein EJ05DRAFT_500136 [Pseudovirgaria hyperparasitica]|uniref:Zn(2)-C6 fungal-type domain-containing protein n=1 Tax=Pseudovirgaria hyperparasitica TaxID=470096 RepID=A0A6A6W9R0_9PEZI|nr:uncharacterized protein EJ05DRAFT_500136 [Pseudovirgaria hyperparasitica]KAF2758616.1 hypothetical protein EJ05DRAFT_500136 [Pseudovirgaria hyperparasitica]